MLSGVKTDERHAARELRAQGYSVKPIYGSIQEYGGFERPEWLD
jgi:hypothetical protein